MRECQKMSGNIRLSAKQEQTILEIINPANKTMEDVAKKIGINERTLYRWLTLPQFKRRLQGERNRLREQGFNKLKALLNAAVERLGNLLDDASSSIKLRASQTVVDYNIKVAEIEEVEQRLARLEESVSQSGKKV